MTYDLNYLEIPAVLKYKYEVDDHFSIQPQVGGYFAVGVGGKIKNFAEREAESSFKDANFRRLDGGIRIGCGIGYDMFYADLTYDIGLANICHDSFDKSRNGALQFNFGVNLWNRQSPDAKHIRGYKLLTINFTQFQVSLGEVMDELSSSLGPYEIGMGVGSAHLLLSAIALRVEEGAVAGAALAKPM